MQTFLLTLCLLGLSNFLWSQDEPVFVNIEFEYGQLERIHPTGMPTNKVLRPHTKEFHHPFLQPILKESENTTIDYLNKTKTTQGVPVEMGRNFEGNHLYGGIPADAAIGISNGGQIVSIDNATVAYFKENGDSVVKYGLPLAEFYQDSSLTGFIFDPRVIYDREADRFIVVLVYLSEDYTDSRILVSFSKPLTSDSISWNHYQISCDSIYTEPGEAMYWIDYTHIAINKDELFVSGKIFNYDSLGGGSFNETALLLQVEKDGGYSGAPQLLCKEWERVMNADGNAEGLVVPLSDGYQSANYGPGCYLVSNYAGGSSKFFWYELTGGINDPNAQIISHLTATGFFYSVPSYASQPGVNGDDRIRFSDCRIQSGYHQEGKLHFVLHRSDMGWGEIVYAKISVNGNSFVAHTWGGAEDTLNSFYPSIAPYGPDSLVENAMICFLRTGPSVFPQLCAINFDTSWSPSAKVIKAGEGLIDQKEEFAAPWDSLERFGDYTDIQRRFNDPNGNCWLVGSYAAGPAANHFGVIDGIKAWIAEVGDTLSVGVLEPRPLQTLNLGPNPVRLSQNPQLNLTFASPEKGKVLLVNTEGKTVFSTKFIGRSLNLRLTSLSEGLYFVHILTNATQYETYKLLILP